MTPNEIDALAARLKALERVAAAAEVYLRHIAGFRLLGDNGEAVDVFNQDMPEAIALQDALNTLAPGRE